MIYDVAIVGASIAGCTAAMLYGRAGLSVALIEKRRSPHSYKVLCGHFVLGGTQAALRRMDLWDHMVEAGAATGAIASWSRAGWAEPQPGLPQPISLRRERLDPMLRSLASSTPGVDLMLGHSALELIEDGVRVAGIRVADTSGDELDVRARLVVGADGVHSKVAELAGAREDRSANERFGYWAYYRGVKLRGPGSSKVWFLDPDVAIATPTDDGLTLLAAFARKARRPEFAGDLASGLEKYLSVVEDAPDLTNAERVSKVVGTIDYPCIKRSPTPRPGLALVGDAALTGDPTPAVGCGWAFRGAEWLVDATATALREAADVDTALRSYRKAFRFIEGHDRIMRSDARARPMNGIQRAIRVASVHDAVVGRASYLFAMRAIPVSGLLNPRIVLRALRVARRARRLPSGSSEAVSASLPAG